MSYPAAQRAPHPGRADCGMVFHRPRAVALPPAHGLRGTLTFVSYPEHFWGKAAVVVAAATTPSAGTLRACVQAGQWHIRGRGVLDGSKVIELVWPSDFERLWVSAASFLPVRIVSAGPDVDTITFSFSFLPPTAANKAALTAPIPARFAKRPLFGP